MNNLMVGDALSLGSIEHHGASKINIFVGPNGGGKSTVLDVVRSLANADLLKTIARENIKSSTASAFAIRFDNGCSVGAVFNQMGVDVFGLGFYVATRKGREDFSGKLYKKSSKLPKELKALVESLSAKVSWRSSHDERGASTKEFVDSLNQDARYLVGLAPYPIRAGRKEYTVPPDFSPSQLDLSEPIGILDGGRVSVSLNDDRLQRNHVSIKMFPSGWRAYGGLVAWLNARDDKSICVIEEPETHLHPTLQRLLMQRVCEIVERKNLQLFISTHSSVLIDIASWPGTVPKLFEADGDGFFELTEPAMAMSGLGVRPGDVFQANGVIWVEGASDRIYLLHWMKLWCEKNNEDMPVENLHFSFAFYGGAMLSHFVPSLGRGFIDMFKVNRNSIVVMDRDLDFIRGKNGEEVCVKKGCAKEAVLTRFLKDFSLGQFCWLTEGYTVEGYLPCGFRGRYFSDEAGRLLPVGNISKVAIAQKFCQSVSDFDLSYREGCDIPLFIDRLLSAIGLWNR
ncbi:AAA family ATPase [Pseudomonas aeruginosa]|uniref:ATP-dependent nuclease n=1 Tax=Pseudomonas aeruginosa TaxID=287 RepID=UPI001F19B2FB|nr:AAA family ATPase [Pseudomonas aeruginosa]MCO5622224.1 AAA family ATPase [Pseudomonas aeruginosa]MDI2274857.1 AAA family ATPase [Pseudomonas aeruginosa]MDI2543578.1 AAA family ATPase [Pseudomonas aeruginosa]